jgi:hypothetical protein
MEVRMIGCAAIFTSIPFLTFTSQVQIPFDVYSWGCFYLKMA